MTLTAGAIARKSDIEAAILTTGTYTPVLTAATATPVLGATGYLTGNYARIGRSVSAWIELNIEGAGASLVGTSWRITIPYLADLSLHTANILNAVSTRIGGFTTRTPTAGEFKNGAALLAGPSGTDTTGTAVVLYAGNTSIGGVDFTTSVRMHINVHYIADAALTLV